MCFGSQDKHDEAPAPRPTQMPDQKAPSSAYPSHQQGQYQHAAGPSDDFAPPPGPPPSSKKAAQNDDYAAPSGPPPSKQSYGGDYAAPPGPPPSHDYAPPAGPPPPQDGKKQHAWEEAVPDTALLPPPPNFFSAHEYSPTNNATEQEAEDGERWCQHNALYNPLQLDGAALNALQVGNINLFTPPSFQGVLAQTGTGVWKGHSYAGCRDTHIASYPPLYCVSAHSPRATQKKKTIYYEVNILRESRHEVSLALGFVAPPYPAFRLPGWHRGSVGVHGDDGRKYVNDRWGGKDFAPPFQRGQTVGLGMDLAPDGAVEIFHTRDGHEIGRWNLHEELDAQTDLPVNGLEGFHDLCAAVGVFDKVSFEIVFAPGQWKWKGYRG
ncbi:hypothetical protein E8E14_007632 [Neopestalotiopsis sp. 37M]|nr:hypothetical protein E8E14_007632 [Neopestalotiopsis sp. 37M]